MLNNYLHHADPHDFKILKSYTPDHEDIIGVETESCCSPTKSFSATIANDSYPNIELPVFDNGSMFSNRAGSSSSYSWPAYGVGAGALVALPFTPSEVAIAIIIIVIIVIILLSIINYFR